LFGDSTLPGQYATLICGKASKSGAVSICNAGHPPALLSRHGKIEEISATGLPLGMFPDQEFSQGNLRLDSGDTLILYTDGVVDALNIRDEEYGMSRLIDLATESRSCAPETFVKTCLSDLSSFRGAGTRFDDISVMGIRRA
jgi:phosphoserine phosphatase RsbU/P